MKSLIYILEALLLAEIFYFLSGNRLQLVILPAGYFFIGFIHGRYLKEKVLRALLSLLIIGAITGIWMTVLFYLLNPPGEKGYFIVSLLINILTFAPPLLSHNALGWICALIGIATARALPSKAET